MYTARSYMKAESLQQAYDLHQKKANAILGGGCWMRLANRSYDTLIDLSGLGLDQIEDGADEIALGAMVTLRQLETSSLCATYFGGLFAKCTQHIVGVQFRNCATLGGSVAARFGFSDIITALLALDCQVELVGAGRISLAEYVNMPRSRDVLTGIFLKKNGRKAVYQSARNSQTDLPTLTCALSTLDGTYRAAIGARPAKPLVVEDTDFSSLVQKVDELTYGSNMRGSEAYRRHLAGVLLKRAHVELEGEA